MSWVSKTLNSTIGRKLIMSLTGLFLILFLLGHVMGNALLFKNDEGQAFNEYAKFMTTNQFVQILSILTYLSIIGHIVYSIFLSIRNKKARPIGYEVRNASSNSTWSSRNMGILGTIILIFLVIHLQDFWFTMHFGEIPYVYYDGTAHKDLYSIVVFVFQELWIVVLYVVSMVFLAFHLAHGFASAFQTLGLRHSKYTPAIKALGLTFSIVVPVAFATMPIYIYFFTSN